MTAEYRRGYEFSPAVKRQAIERADGKCELLGCSRPNSGCVDHKVGIKISILQGADKEAVRRLDNAQLLCRRHDFEKGFKEVRFINSAYCQIRFNELKQRRDTNLFRDTFAG